MESYGTVQSIISYASIFSAVLSIVWAVLKFYLAFLAIRFFRHENERYKKEKKQSE